MASCSCSAAQVLSNENYFLSGGEDKQLMLWKYDEGICYYRGEGHAGHIRKVAFL